MEDVKPPALSLDWIRAVLDTTPTGPVQPWAPRKANASCEPCPEATDAGSWESSCRWDDLEDEPARRRSRARSDACKLSGPNAPSGAADGGNCALFPPTPSTGPNGAGSHADDEWTALDPLAFAGESRSPWEDLRGLCDPGPVEGPWSQGPQRPVRDRQRAPLERAGASDLSAVLHEVVFRATSRSKTSRPPTDAWPRCRTVALEKGGQDFCPSSPGKALPRLRSTTASVIKGPQFSGASDVEDCSEDAATPMIVDDAGTKDGSPRRPNEAEDDLPGTRLGKRKRILRERQRRTNIRQQVVRLRSMLPKNGAEGIPEDTASIIAAAADYIRQLQQYQESATTLS